MRMIVKDWICLCMAASLLMGCGFRKYEPIGLETADAGGGVDVVIIDTEAGGNPSAADCGEGGDFMDGQEDAGAVLLFGGDVFLSDHVLEAYRKAGGISGVLDTGYRKEIADADLFFVNEEFPFSSRGIPAADKQYTFRLPPEKVRILQEMGVDGVTLANNHALDYGLDALLDTCGVLDEAGILHTGAGTDLEAAKGAARYEIKGKTFAVIGATRVIPDAGWAAGRSHGGMLSAYDPSALVSEVSALSKENDYVVAYLHWGIERDELPQDYQRAMGRQLIDAGADLVIGAHPHVLQGIEYYQGKPIVHSLGNFVFGSQIPRTALLKAVFTEDRMTLALLPGTSGAGYTRMLDSDAKREEFFGYMERISFGVGFDEDGDVVPGD